MKAHLKAALCATVMTCASPASATSTIDFVISSAGPLSYASDSAGFLINYTATSDVAATFKLTLSAYDFTICNVPACSGYDPNRIAEVTLLSSPMPTERSSSIILPFLGGRFGPISVVFSSESAVPITVSLTTIGANLVPEPSTWALMLAGFALTGYALRRRRASVSFA